MRTVRIQFRLDVEDGYPPVGSELIHAEQIGPEAYRIANTPFFVEGVAMEDIVRCKQVGDGLVEFVRLESESGNKAISVIFVDCSVEEMVCSDVRAMGHYCERGAFPEFAMLAICVSREASLDRILSYLDTLESSGAISWAGLCMHGGGSHDA